MNQKKVNKNELLEDFDDLELISKKWKEHKPQDSSSSNLDTESDQFDTVSHISQPQLPQQQELSSSQLMQYAKGQEQNKTFKKPNKEGSNQNQKRNHFPQIIDEDTEQFKVRLDHILNVFKTDAISEFMVMKKSILEDQKSNIKSETERYLQMYEEKALELMTTKQQLAEKINECECLNQKNENLAKLSGDSKNKFWLLKTLGKYFTTFQLYKKYKSEKKQKRKVADFLYKKNLQKRIFKSWMDNFGEFKLEKLKQETENNHLEEIEELTNRFNKQILDLQENLKEVNSNLESANEQKLNMQENLKKVYLRGICALNFEAMNIINNNNSSSLDKTKQDDQSQKILQQTSNISNALNSMQSEYNSLLINPIRNDDLSDLTTSNYTQNINNNNNRTPLQAKSNNQSNTYTQNQLQNVQQEEFIKTQNQDFIESTSQNQKKSIVYFSDPKIESKDHKWKDAPIVGISAKQNKENDYFQSQQQTQKLMQSTLPDFIGNDLDSFQNIPSEEGRVIRVNPQTQNKSVKFDINEKTNSSSISKNNKSKQNVSQQSKSNLKTATKN